MDRPLIASQEAPWGARPVAVSAAVLSDPERLLWIDRSGIASTRGGEAFDRLARIAQQLLDVPVALVTVVTDTEQVFAGAVGVPMRQTPLSHSLCQYVVSEGAPLVLSDTYADALVCDHPAVRGLHVRAYLGVPFVSPSGHVLGSLCAIDTRPRDWTERDLNCLHDLAQVANTEIALRLELKDRAQAEAQLLRDKEQLGMTAVESAAALGASHEALRAANTRLAQQNVELLRRQEELRAFTATLSHDLQEPVRKIRTFASLLAPALPFEEDRIHLDRLEHTAEQMHARLRALVSYADVSLASGLHRPEWLDLNALVDARAGALSCSHLSVTRDALPRVRGYAPLLSKLFAELFDNAVRFRRHGVPLRIHVSAERFGDADDAEVELRVEDSGMGFEPRYAERIFEPFERLLPLAENAGTGLGLTLCRRVAERHGGSLRAEASPGAGATFVLRLPEAGPSGA